MRIKPIVTTIFGVAIAAGSVLFAREQIFQPGTKDMASGLAQVVVARADIDFSQPVEAHMLTVQAWPIEAMPIGAFTEIEQIVARSGQEPRRAKGRFFMGEVILASKVSGYGEKVTLVQKLGENTRAMAIKVDAVTAVGGFVTPGDYIDILMTQSDSGNYTAVTILQNIRVLGVDQQSEEQKNQPEVARTLTVEVTPDQGQRLALAQKAGSLSLTLRTLNNVEDKLMDMVDMRDLLQNDSPVEDEDKRPTITVRRANFVAEESIR
ncbi:Flp pilus assembly protein CpaB [Puniceibacterium confluentis]|nr:Flp pilus assembly protein CpaB [Puniceibacterium confluentis]